MTIFIPAHNEEASIASTVHYLQSQLNYPADSTRSSSSTTRPLPTADILPSCRRSTRTYVSSPSSRTVEGTRPQLALAYANGDFILSNDADTKPNPDALWQFLSYFEREATERGAVTGNMLAANRTTLPQRHSRTS